MSEPDQIYPALIEAARLMEGVEKGGYNSAQKFKFRGVEQLTAACAPIFKEVGIIMVPTITNVTCERQPDKGYRAIVEATYTFYAADGSSVSAMTVGEGVDSYDKATNKAMSAAFKYALLQTLCIGDPEDDLDATPVASNERAAPAPPRSRATNEVSAEDWKFWEGSQREPLLADDGKRQQFVDWLAEHSITVERSMPKATFDKVVEKAAELLK